ncbi:toxin-like protein [Paenibacillus larvae subsp. larvae]|uniref:Toxin-like protein n=1 Tax=Paenibacillus larvae subsp. larvae TaxID=147375 RepID=A0A6C0QSD0_9BACL|nr:toxin-like protein [Paenibacillus larvae subsp. larvae]
MADLPDAPPRYELIKTINKEEEHRVSFTFNNFEEIPILQVNRKTNYEINLDSEVNSKDCFDVISSAGEVETEFINKLYSNSYNMGKHTVTSMHGTSTEKKIKQIKNITLHLMCKSML